MRKGVLNQLQGKRKDIRSMSSWKTALLVVPYFDSLAQSSPNLLAYFIKMGSDFELKIKPTIDDDTSSTFELQLAEGSATLMKPIPCFATLVRNVIGTLVRKSDVTLPPQQLAYGVWFSEVLKYLTMLSMSTHFGVEPIKDSDQVWPSEVPRSNDRDRSCLRLWKLAERPTWLTVIMKRRKPMLLMEQLKKKNAETERLHKIEYVAEIQPDEIEKLKGSEMDEDIDVPKIRSVEGIEVAEVTSKGTASHKKETQTNAEARNGDKATMINKKPYVKTQSQASIDREARELKELETDKEPEDIGSPYLQRPANQHDEKGADRKGRSFQTKYEVKDAREECKSTHEDSSKEAKQEKKQDSKQLKMRTSIIIAGSALLASLVTVAFNLVKSKTEKNVKG
ncbi:hypothetical protein E6C27_scaffold518G00820 [Cucumis melo var. makuwa]|uniref:Uncharacterized protein n=1 Tax=Cucumis melo var. makuwa TaxID=1194695 RepID=A0A5A7UWU5_CUCMM|nr:hypothetical protein E6C27_scaffold518G00820 [Cucumis melo var. makuwa]